MSNKIMASTELAYYISLEQDVLLDSLRKYKNKVQKISQNLDHTRVSQDEYFRIKHNFAHVEELITDLLQVKTYSFHEETKLAFEELKIAISDIIQKLCIDYTVEDAPQTQAYTKNENGIFELVSFETSYVLNNDKFIIFEPVNEYKYTHITASFVEESTTEMHEPVQETQTTVTTQEEMKEVVEENQEKEDEAIEIIELKTEVKEAKNDEIARTTNYYFTKESRWTWLFVFLLAIVLIAVVVLVGLHLIDSLTINGIFNK
ncbi:hypothetical protein MBVG596_0339 [Mycoplasmopsis bovigenitalium]|uniref:hypothetical protein n=1 Tax=Mycoplasmopsis bovigenitalium TaxID=2112 RepID=UPI00090C7768|nr:hypothetical protein [Mycoplasmopsis bovigenitalium]BAW18161.1 hypothetical protein MBVG596_0339 [Mycoplasmopsis bovigenitalium]